MANPSSRERLAQLEEKYSAHKMEDLKALLRARGTSPAGRRKKQELVDRLSRIEGMLRSAMLGPSCSSEMVRRRMLILRGEKLLRWDPEEKWRRLILRPPERPQTSLE